jgi:hypothetical protein
MVDVEFIKLRHARDGWSIREISRRTGRSRQAIRKALAAPAAPPRYELSAPRPSPVMGPYLDLVRGWLDGDESAPPKQRHTARRICDRLVDELGYLPLGPGAPLLFQFFAERYGAGSVLITSNLEFSRWSEVFGDATLTAPLLDRLTHHSQVLIFEGGPIASARAAVRSRKPSWNGVVNYWAIAVVNYWVDEHT